MTNHAYITRTACCLPGEPVTNDQIETVLGRVDGRPSRAGPIILPRNGIKQRHYAIDPKTGLATMSNAQMAARAVEMLDAAPLPSLLTTATSLPDRMDAHHGSAVLDELKWGPLELLDFSGICCSGVAALRYALLALRCGEHRRAVVVASEAASRVMRADYFQPEIDAQISDLIARPELAFDKEFLRWMLSDGAGAFLVENAPSGPLSLRIEWIALSSRANELPVCMYAGGVKQEDGTLRSWTTMTAEERRRTSVFSVKQDVRLLTTQVAGNALLQPLREIIETHHLKVSEIDWFLPHMSSKFFEKTILDTMAALDFRIPQERWFTNLASKGNTGSASPFIMLDELFRSNLITPGQRLLLFVPESGRFSNGFIFLTAVGQDD